jgi:Kef-type K+ transport system membrane component KefB
MMLGRRLRFADDERNRVSKSRRFPAWWRWVLFLSLAWGTEFVFGREPSAAIEGAIEHAAHDYPVTPLLLGISVILLVAKLGGDLMVRLKQPAVLGELLVGMILGNLVLFGFDGLEFVRAAGMHGDPHAREKMSLAAMTLDMLARIGVILLLFEVGLESNIQEMRRVGLVSLTIAVIGVLAPLALGWGVGRWLLPDHSWHVHLFIGATLCATSIGITARVLKDLGKVSFPRSESYLGCGGHR